MDNWRQLETDEPEASYEEVFGPPKPQDRLTRALGRVRDLMKEAEANGLDDRLVTAWERKIKDLNDADEAENFADYLAA
jgi:hypothetical protein